MYVNLEDIPKEDIEEAYRQALSFIQFDSHDTKKESKTKLMAQVIKALGAEDQKALLVLAGRDETVIRAGKNIPTLKDAYVNTINVYDLLNADKIIVLKGAMQDLQEVYA